MRPEATVGWQPAVEEGEGGERVGGAVGEEEGEARLEEGDVFLRLRAGGLG